jgi:hypothetical protein
MRDFRMFLQFTVPTNFPQIVGMRVNTQSQREESLEVGLRHCWGSAAEAIV